MDPVLTPRLKKIRTTKKNPNYTNIIKRKKKNENENMSLINNNNNYLKTKKKKISDVETNKFSKIENEGIINNFKNNNREKRSNTTKMNEISAFASIFRDIKEESNVNEENKALNFIFKKVLEQEKLFTYNNTPITTLNSYLKHKGRIISIKK